MQVQFLFYFIILFFYIILNLNIIGCNPCSCGSVRGFIIDPDYNDLIFFGNTVADLTIDNSSSCQTEFLLPDKLPSNLHAHNCIHFITDNFAATTCTSPFDLFNFCTTGDEFCCNMSTCAVIPVTCSETQCSAADICPSGNCPCIQTTKPFVKSIFNTNR